jgi:hypothetical protein
VASAIKYIIHRILIFWKELSKNLRVNGDAGCSDAGRQPKRRRLEDQNQPHKADIGAHTDELLLLLTLKFLLRHPIATYGFAGAGRWLVPHQN